MAENDNERLNDVIDDLIILGEEGCEVVVLLLLLLLFFSSFSELKDDIISLFDSGAGNVVENERGVGGGGFEGGFDLGIGGGGLEGGWEGIRGGGAVGGAGRLKNEGSAGGGEDGGEGGGEDGGEEEGGGGGGSDGGGKDILAIFKIEPDDFSILEEEGDDDVDEDGEEVDETDWEEEVKEGDGLLFSFLVL